MEGGGLECEYEDGDQLENQGHHQWVCESRIGTTGERGWGEARRPWCSLIFPCFGQLSHLIGVSGRWEGGSGTSLEQYIPSASTSQVVPEEKEAERSTTRRASHLPRSLEERKRVARAGGVSELRFFFIYCIAELAVKPCRSSRSNTRGGFEKIP